MEENKLPKHVAFIMDGNRRWARGKKLPIIFGHRKGYRRIEEVVKHAKAKGIKHVTFWAFSTENWNREKKEVEDLMKVFREVFKKSSMNKLMEEGALISVFGDLTPFPKDLQENINKLMNDTKKNTNIQVNFALNYGGRAEVLRAITLLIKSAQEVNEENLSNNLYSKGQPDPDLLIRTGGEMRLSGYLPWQSVYSELYFSDVLWPDFDSKQLDIALAKYATRQRRFGK